MYFLVCVIICIFEIVSNVSIFNIIINIINIICFGFILI